MAFDTWSDVHKLTTYCHVTITNADYAAASRKKPMLSRRDHDTRQQEDNMHKEPATDAGFPGIAFATLPDTGETIAIRYGERLYYRVDSAKTADVLSGNYFFTEAPSKFLGIRLPSIGETPPVAQDSH